MASIKRREGLSFVLYEADGVDQNYPFAFDYISKEYIKVSVGGTPTLDFTYNNANEIRLGTIPSVGVLVSIVRETNSQNKIVDFVDGGIITEKLLDIQFDQVIDLVQEATDIARSGISIDQETQTADLGNARLTNVATPINPLDGSNKQYVDDRFTTFDGNFTAVLNSVNASEDNVEAIQIDVTAKAAQVTLDAAQVALDRIAVASDKADVNATVALLVPMVPEFPAVKIAVDDLVDNAVMKTGVQTVSDKIIVNGKIQTPDRLDFKADTKANLITYALTATNGQAMFATDTKEYFAVNDGALVSLGGDSFNATLIRGVVYPQAVVEAGYDGDLQVSQATNMIMSPSGKYLVVRSVTTPNTTIYMRQGDAYNAIPLPTGIDMDYPVAWAFSPDDSYLAIICEYAPEIRMYKVSNDTEFTLLPSIYDPLIDPMYGVLKHATWSPDGVYVTVTLDGAERMRTYKVSTGDVFTAVADPDVFPIGIIRGFRYSPDSTILTVAHTTTPFVTNYKITTGDVFTKLANPAALPSGPSRNPSYSSDGVYMSVVSAASPYIHIYKRSGDVFTKLANPAILPTGAAENAEFSKDGKYLAVAHATTPFITIYKLGVSDSFNKISNMTANAPTAQLYDLCFSADSKFLFIIQNLYSSLVKYEILGGDIFEPHQRHILDYPELLGNYLAFSPDGNFLTASVQSAPFHINYKRIGDSFLRLPPPAAAITHAVRSIEFSADSMYQFIGTQTTPFIHIYKRTGDIFTKLANPATLPASMVRGIYSYMDGTFLTITLQSTPFVITYKRSGDVFTKVDDPLPAFPTTGLPSIAPDGSYMFVSHNSGSYNTIMYKLLGDRWIGTEVISPMPTVGCTSAWSPDSKRLAIIPQGVMEPVLLVYEKVGNTFTLMSENVSTPDVYMGKLIFSFCGNYLFIITNLTYPLLVCKLENGTWNLIGRTGSNVYDAQEFRISPDSKWLVAFRGRPVLLKARLSSFTKGAVSKITGIVE